MGFIVYMLGAARRMSRAKAFPNMTDDELIEAAHALHAEITSRRDRLAAALAPDLGITADPFDIGPETFQVPYMGGKVKTVIRQNVQKMGKLPPPSSFDRKGINR